MLVVTRGYSGKINHQFLKKGLVTIFLQPPWFLLSKAQDALKMHSGKSKNCPQQ